MAGDRALNAVILVRIQVRQPKTCYNNNMRNWSTDEKLLKKNPEKYNLWKLEQLINFGLGDEKLSIQNVKKNINKLSIDPLKKRYLKFLVK